MTTSLYICNQDTLLTDRYLSFITGHLDLKEMCYI